MQSRTSPRNAHSLPPAAPRATPSSAGTRSTGRQEAGATRPATRFAAGIPVRFVFPAAPGPRLLGRAEAAAPRAGGGRGAGGGGAHRPPPAGEQRRRSRESGAGPEELRYGAVRGAGSGGKRMSSAHLLRQLRRGNLSGSILFNSRKDGGSVRGRSAAG